MCKISSLPFQLTTAQIIAHTQVQQVAGGSQPIATLVKTMTTQPGVTPSIALPVSAVTSLGNVNINVTLPQQKTLVAGEILSLVRNTINF